MSNGQSTPKPQLPLSVRLLTASEQLAAFALRLRLARERGERLKLTGDDIEMLSGASALLSSIGEEARVFEDAALHQMFFGGSHNPFGIQ